VWPGDLVLNKEVKGKGKGREKSDLSALPLRDLVFQRQARDFFSRLPPIISPRLSCASTDGYNTENDVPLSTDP
jgi:hypothetical protein